MTPQQDAMNANKLALEYLKMAKLYGPAMAYANTTIDDAIRGIEAVIAQQPATKGAE